MKNKWINMAAKSVIVTGFVVAIALVVTAIFIITFVVQNPEAIGDWVRRVLGA